MIDKWGTIRRQFALRPEFSHFAALVFTSHPTPVAIAIDYHRGLLDFDGFRYFMRDSPGLKLAALEAAASYFAVPSGLVALTTGTTMGLAQVLGGVTMKPRHRFLTSINEHPAITETLKLRHRRDGITNRPPFETVRLFAKSGTATKAEILDNLRKAITPDIRVLILTWVYSSDGVKLPLRDIARIVEETNTERGAEEDRLLFMVDGVHGFGIEDVTFAELGCDILVAGCHKSIFGPRGTGVIYGKPEAWSQIVPWVALLAAGGGQQNPGWDHIPGGVRAYEHQWALADAFQYHQRVLRKADVEARVRMFANLFKRELEAINGATLVTPTDPELSSGLICADVEGYTVSTVISELERDGVIASTSAPDESGVNRTHVRFAVSILNTEVDVARAVRSLRRLTHC